MLIYEKHYSVGITEMQDSTSSVGHSSCFFIVSQSSFGERHMSIRSLLQVHFDSGVCRACYILSRNPVLNTVDNTQSCHPCRR